jgi:dihydroflavonol-4-reductase
MMNKKRFLVTGATGFLGRHLLEHIQEQYPDTQSIPLVRNRSNWDNENWVKDLNINEIVTGSLSDIVNNSDSIGELDGIFHLAALVRHSRSHSEDVYKTNIEGTLNTVRLAASKKCRLIYVSTSGTVGVFNSRHEWADEHSPYREKEISKWPYYDSKLKAEREARKLAKELNVELVIIRPPVLLGPKDHRFRSTSHIIKYLRGKLPFLIRGGMHFIDIRDAVGALANAMIHQDPKPIYHLSGVSCSIDTFFEMVQKASGVKPPKYHLPYPVAITIANSVSTLSKVLNKEESPLPDPVVIEMANKFWDTRSLYSSKDLGFYNRNGQETINDTVKWLIDNHEKLKVLGKK